MGSFWSLVRTVPAIAPAIETTEKKESIAINMVADKSYDNGTSNEVPLSNVYRSYPIRHRPTTLSSAFDAELGVASSDQDK